MHRLSDMIFSMHWVTHVHQYMTSIFIHCNI